MKYTAMYFDSVIQCWGKAGCLDHRRTEQYPTKSATAGIVMRAMGSKDNEILKKINNTGMISLNFAGDSKSKIDFQIIGNDAKNPLIKIKKFEMSSNKDKKEDSKTDQRLLYKEYLQDTVTAAIFFDEDENFLNEIYESVKSPAKALFIGRSKCIPSSPIAHGVFNNLEETINSFVTRINSERKCLKINYVRCVYDVQKTDIKKNVCYTKDLAIDRASRTYIYRKIKDIYLKADQIADTIEQDII